MNAMNNSISSVDELEEMRQQLSDFKQMLKQQQIVSERMMRRSVQNDYSKERKTVLLVSAMSLVALPAWVVITFVMKMLPVWFFVLTMLYMAFCVAFTFYSVHRYISDDMMTDNVVRVAENVLAYKRLNNRWLIFIGIPSVVVWVALFFYAVGLNSGSLAHGLAVGGFVGLVIGSVCGTTYYVGSMRRLNRIISYLNEFKGLHDASD